MPAPPPPDLPTPAGPLQGDRAAPDAPIDGPTDGATDGATDAVDHAPSDPPATPAAAPGLSAFDRVQTRLQAPVAPFTDAAGARGAFWKVVAVVVVVAAVTAGAWWTLTRDADAGSDLLTRYAEIAADYQPALLTVSPEQAERYVEETSGWIIDAPELPALQVVGVGFADLSPEASVPAFRYDGASGESVLVYAYDYVFLDSVRGRFDLPEAVYAGLAEDEAVDTRRLGDHYFVSWRSRAVVFTAVTSDERTFERLGVGVQAPS